MERLWLIAQLNKLTVKERLEAIARDQQHPIQYHPPEFATIETEQLMLLDRSDKPMLLLKIENRKKGPWKQLALRLRAARDLAFLLGEDKDNNDDVSRSSRTPHQ